MPPAPPIEPPAPTDRKLTSSVPGETSMGDVFRESLSKQQQAKAPVAKETPKAETPSKTETTPAKSVEKPKEETPATKKSALDAALEQSPSGDKPPESKPVEDNPLADLDEGKPDWKKARSRLEQQHSALKERDSAIAKLNQELSTAKEAPELKKQLEAVRAENAKLKDAVTALNVEYDPEFRAKYIDGKKALLDKASARVKEYGGDEEAFNAALSLTGKRRTEALKEALSEVDEIDRPRIISLLDKVTELEDARTELTKDPQQAFERLQRERTEASQRINQEAEQLRIAEFEKVARKLPESFVLLRTLDPSVEGADEWNTGVKTALENAKRLLSPNATFEEIVSAAVKGSRADHLQTLWLDERQKRVAAEKALSEYDGAEPGIRGTGKSKSKDPLDRKPGDLYREAIAKSTEE